MTPLDQWVGSVSTRLEGLSRREAAALYFAVGLALRVKLDEWVSRVPEACADVEALFRLAETYVTSGEVPEDVEAAVALLDRGVPPGESPDEFSTTAAQDCWIAVDTSLRIGIAEFPVGDGFWYCVEPLAQAISEAKFGYSELDSAEEEAAMAIFDDPALRSARVAVDEMLDALESGGVDALPEIVDLARALVPE